MSTPVRLSTISSKVENLSVNSNGDLEIRASDCNLRSIVASEFKFDNGLRLRRTAGSNQVELIDASANVIPVGSGSGNGSGSVTNTSTFEPASNNQYDLGTVAKRWKNLYLAGNAISFGDGITINSFNWNYLANYVVPSGTQNASAMRMLGRGGAQDHSGYVKNGEVWVFGRNDQGQLGLGDTVNRTVPTRIQGITTASNIAFGQGFTVVTLTQGTAVAFGANANGQLGDGTTVSKSNPVSVLGLSNALQPSAGYNHAIYLLGDGKVVGCGGNARGQLGVDVSDTSVTNSTIRAMSLPSFATDSNLTPRFITTGGTHSCVLLANGSTYLTGDNTFFQLGSSNTPAGYATIPGVLPGVSNVVSAACGENHTVLIRYSGEVITFGRNDAGQLGIGNKTVVTTPQSVLAAPGASFSNAGLYMEADAGLNHTVVLRHTSNLNVWGNNAQGQLGLGQSVTEALTPTLLNGGISYYSAACGRYHSTFLMQKSAATTDNVLQACGDNSFGQVGDGSTSNALGSTSRFFANVIYEGIYAKQLSRGTLGTQSAYVDTDGVQYLWGQNANGQLGVSSNVVPQRLLGAMNGSIQSRITRMANGNTFSVVLDSAGTVYAWGANASGQLGNNSTTSTVTPVNVSTFGSLIGRVVVDITAGFGHVIALDSTGAVHCWGANDSGQLGRGTTSGASASIPVSISSSGSLSGKTIVAIAAGDGHSLALDSTGAVHAWGNNGNGQLGNNTLVNSTSPINVSSFGTLSGRTIVWITASTLVSGAVDSTGAAHIWGYNGSWQLASGSIPSTGYRSNATNISTFGSLSNRTITRMEAAATHVLALDSTGTLHGWGSNGSIGAVGNNSTANTFTPVDLSSFGSLTGKTIVSMATGFQHSIALDSAGGLHTWGLNSNGQLGQNNIISRSNAILITSNIRDVNPAKTAVGYGPHELFYNRPTAYASNVLEAAGCNANMQLGDGTAIDRPLGTRLGFPVAVRQAANSETHSVVLLANGQVYAWGRNNMGQCGQTVMVGPGGASNVPTPTLVPGISGAKAVAAGGEFTLVLNGDNTVSAFGSASNGKLGVSSNPMAVLPSGCNYTSTPTLISSLANISTIACGAEHAVAINADGRVYTWGLNTSGQAATGGGVTSNTLPTLIDDTVFGGQKVVTAACGQAHTALVLAGTGSGTTLYTAGLNDAGQLGRSSNFGTALSNAAFGIVSGMGTEASALKVACGNKHTVVQLANGRIRTFGSNGTAQILGVATTGGSNTFTPQDPGVTDITGVGVGTNTTFYETTDGQGVYGFGVGAPVQAIRMTGNSANTYVVAGRAMYRSMTNCTIGNAMSLAARGRLYNWGVNGVSYTLGDGTTTNRSTPTLISDNGGSITRSNIIVATSMGYRHGLAVDASGFAYSWGSNDAGFGQLGSGSATGAFTVPARITAGSLSSRSVVAVAAGTLHSLALDSTGAVHAWGRNVEGQLNTGNTTQQVSATNVSTNGSLSNRTVVAISTGDGHALALDSGGLVHAWGYNNVGQLGTGNTTQQNSAVNVTTNGSLSGRTILAVSCGYDHSIALDSTGAVHAWGNNGSGRLGNNSTTQSSLPVNISSFGSLSGKTITAISAGLTHSLALDSSGAVHAWGNNSSGALGNNTTSTQSNAIDVSSFGSLSGKTVVQIAACSDTSYALDTTGNLHAWGNNASGQLGDGTATQRNIPVQIAQSSFGYSGVTTLTPFLNFTGQHRCFVEPAAAPGSSSSSLASSEGLIVVADKNAYIQDGTFVKGRAAITVNDSLPLVSLCTTQRDKRAFGVISLKPGDETTRATPEQLARLAEQGDVRAEINSLGEGALWVSDLNGPIESGDYITSAGTPAGYGMKQDEDGVCNFTVAKSTMDCDFSAPLQPAVEVVKDAYGNNVVDPLTGMPTWREVKELKEKPGAPGELEEVARMEPAYDVRYLRVATGELITKDEYEAAANGDGTVCRAALIGCTYHCG